MLLRVDLQRRLVKTGGRLVKHACNYWLLLAESHLTQRLFASMLGKSRRFRCRWDSASAEATGMRWRRCGGSKRISGIE